MDRDDKLTRDEKLAFWTYGYCCWLIFGFVTAFLMFPDDPPSIPHGIAVILFWPLFVIKYALIGIYLVLEAGLELLV